MPTNRIVGTHPGALLPQPASANHNARRGCFSAENQMAYIRIAFFVLVATRLHAGPIVMNENLNWELET